MPSNADEKDTLFGSYVWDESETEATFEKAGSSNVRGTQHDAPSADACWKCHKHMNPLGDPFEMYDDFGRYRTGLYYDPKRKEFIEQYEWDRISKKKDNGIIAHKVDATGVLSGTGDPA